MAPAIEKMLLQSCINQLPEPYSRVNIQEAVSFNINQGVANKNIVVQSEQAPSFILRFNQFNAHGLSASDMADYEHGMLHMVQKSERTPVPIYNGAKENVPFLAVQFIETTRADARLNYKTDIKDAAISMAKIHRDQDPSQLGISKHIHPIIKDLRRHLLERAAGNIGGYYKEIFLNSSDPAVRYVNDLHKKNIKALKKESNGGILRAVQSDPSRNNWVVEENKNSKKAHLIDWEMGMVTHGIFDGAELDVAAFIANHLTLQSINQDEPQILSEETKNVFIEKYCEEADVNHIGSFRENVKSIIPYLQNDYLSWYVGYRLSGEMECDFDAESFERYNRLYETFEDNMGGAFRLDSDMSNFAKAKLKTLEII